MTAPSALGPTSDLRWLVALRWAAIAGQIAMIGGVELLLSPELALLPLAVIIGIEAGTNAYISLWLRQSREVPEYLAVAALVVDILALTGLLYFTGGPHNPFNFLYLVYIALGAVVLRPRASWALVVLSSLAFGGLFLDSVPMVALGGHGGHGMAPAMDSAAMDHAAMGHGAMDHAAMGHGAMDHAAMGHAHDGGEINALPADPMALHLRGMWVAFTIGAAFIVSFVGRVKRALAEQEEALTAARESASRSERLASLATLAAGAAHELATPLGTIAIAARELELDLADTPGTAAEDARLIRSQVDRCRKVLDRLAVDAGEAPGESSKPFTLAQLLSSAMDGLPEARVQLAVPDGLLATLLPGFETTLSQTLRAVVRNGLDASPTAPVRIAAEARSSSLLLQIQDEGEGMAPEVLARATEPFFSTKAHGRGMGLGLFLARTSLERLGGQLDIASTAGQGTTVTLTLPIQ